MLGMFLNHILLLMAISITAASAQAFEPDHYLSYDIKRPDLHPQLVTLRDQFIDATRFEVTRPLKLLNPTVKHHDGVVYKIKNKRLHYTAYQLKTNQPIAIDKTVVVNNQFGSFTLDAFRPTRLLVPSRKFENGRGPGHLPPMKDDHYLCYDIFPQHVFSQRGFLKDQFRGRNFETFTAKRLCNPVEKTHNGKVSPITNNDDANHLMCFEINKMRIDKKVVLRNQFGAVDAYVITDEEICVPSTKIIVNEPERCGDTGPDSSGICGGVCPEGEVCGVDRDGNCGCDIPIPPPPTCSLTAAGECGGACPGDLSCVASLTGDCECAFVLPPPEPCGLNENGTCGGACPSADQICSTDAAGNCGCFIIPPSPPPVCGFDDNGTCGGVCPNADETCGTDALGNCGCFIPTPPPACGLDENGICGGTCLNVNEACGINDAGNCGCLVPPPPPLRVCGVDDEGTCGGTCPWVTERCIINTTGDCSCTAPEPPQVLCSDTLPDEGVCNGACAIGSICVPNAELATCSCALLTSNDEQSEN